MKRQNIDHTQLLVLSLLAGEDMYGYQMIMELARRSDHTFEMKEGAVPVLHGLERDGAVEAYQQEAAVNRYLGYDAPDGFTDTAVEAMTGLTPVDGESYYEWRMNAMEQYPETEFADMTEAVSGPGSCG